MSDEEILALAARHLHEATADKPIPDYGRWQHWAAEMREAIKHFGSVIEVLHYAESVLPFSHRVESNGQTIATLVAIIKNDFPWFDRKIDQINDDPSSLHVLIHKETKQHVSNMMVWHAWSMLTCQTYLGNAKNILEVGGGNGALARLWMLQFPVNRYVIADIPESLYFAEVWLRKLFGNDVGYLVDDVPDTKIVLIPVDRLELYKKPSDLVLSIGSMQEMNDEWIEHYMRWLDAYDANFFYSLNYAAQPNGIMAESRCMWGPRLSPNWTTLLLTFNPAALTLGCEHRNFLAALYQRKPATNSLKNWSVLHGRLLTNETYIEGLDLVRQCPDEESISLFLNKVCEYYRHWNKGLIPKEVVALARRSKSPIAKRIIEMCVSTNEFV